MSHNGGCEQADKVADAANKTHVDTRSSWLVKTKVSEADGHSHRVRAEHHTVKPQGLPLFDLSKCQSGKRNLRMKKRVLFCLNCPAGQPGGKNLNLYNDLAKT